MSGHWPVVPPLHAHDQRLKLPCPPCPCLSQLGCVLLGSAGSQLFVSSRCYCCDQTAPMTNLVRQIAVSLLSRQTDLERNEVDGDRRSCCHGSAAVSGCRGGCAGTVRSVSRAGAGSAHTGNPLRPARCTHKARPPDLHEAVKATSTQFRLRPPLITTQQTSHMPRL